MPATKGRQTVITALCMLSGVLSQQKYGVTYSSTSICGIKGTFVDIPCTYSYPSGHKIIQTFWHINWYPDTPTDLSLDPKYQGRVEYLGDNVSNCTVRLKDLRESDRKGIYRFRLRTDDPKGQYSGSEVSLSLTDLQVTASPKSVKEGDNVTLTCITTCSLSTNPIYIWYKNSQPLSPSHTTSSNTLIISSVSKADAGYYSCAVRGHEGHPSQSVCVLCQQEYSVTYSSTSICGIKGTLVDIPCTYSYPSGHKIIQTFWHINWYPDTTTDLSLDPNYQGRVKYLGDNVSNCTLRLKDLRESDTTERYRFRFITDDPKGKFSGSEVSLSLTDLHVTVSPESASVGDNVTLTCSTTCSLSTNPTYIWYRNSQPLSPNHTADNRLYIHSARPEDAGKYSCAVKGHEIHRSPEETVSVKYAPRNTLTSVHPSGVLVEGSSVTLTCSSDANPPAHQYNWYRNAGYQQFSHVASSQNYSIANVNPKQGGLYYCVAKNEIGQHRSPDTRVNVTDNYWVPVAVSVIGGLLTGLVAGALIGVAVYRRMTRTRKVKDVSAGAVRGDTAAVPQDNSEHTYTTLNPATKSSEYDTLANVKVSAEGAKFTSAAPEPSDYENYDRSK